jgi:hypothetical protein
MERNQAPTVSRHDVIIRLRKEVADGAYRPPVDELVNRLVNVVIAQHAADAQGAHR